MKYNGYSMKNTNFGKRKVSDDGFRCGPTPHPPVFCVAVKIDGDAIQIRDSKDGNNTTLTFNKGEWNVFIKAVKDGEFDI